MPAPTTTYGDLLGTRIIALTATLFPRRPQMDCTPTRGLRPGIRTGRYRMHGRLGEPRHPKGLDRRGLVAEDVGSRQPAEHEQLETVARVDDRVDVRAHEV